jgi:hypothetical protein
VAVSAETDAEPTMTVDFASEYRATSRRLALLILAANFIISVFNWMMVSAVNCDVVHLDAAHRFEKCAGAALL